MMDHDDDDLVSSMRWTLSTMLTARAAEGRPHAAGTLCTRENSRMEPALGILARIGLVTRMVEEGMRAGETGQLSILTAEGQEIALMAQELRDLRTVLEEVDVDSLTEAEEDLIAERSEQLDSLDAQMDEMLHQMIELRAPEAVAATGTATRRRRRWPWMLAGIGALVTLN